MSNNKGNFIIRLVKGDTTKTKRIKYRFVQGKLTLSLTKSKEQITEKDLREWHAQGWYIETEDVIRAKGMLRESISDDLLIDVRECTES